MLNRLLQNLKRSPSQYFWLGLLSFVFLPALLTLNSCNRKGCTDPDACNYSEKAKNDNGSCEYTSCGFSRKTLLENMSAIIPDAYNKVENRTASMITSIVTFTTFPDQQNLDNLRNVFRSARIDWQYASMFEFGPAEEVLLRANVNTYPADTLQIRQNFVAGAYDLTAANNLDAKGFPAIGYLLYGHGISDEALLEQYEVGVDPYAENRAAYLMDIATDLNSLLNLVHQRWIPEGGNYVSTFEASDGTDAGSSLSLMVNQLSQDFELLKNGQIGIPFGKKSLGELLPEKCEAFYAGYSSTLVQEHAKAIEAAYLGTGVTQQDVGFDDFLIHLESTYDGGLLDDAIKAQMSNTITALSNVPNPLSQAISSDSVFVENAYSEIQDQLVLLKTDLPSALGVLITYVDNDGD